MVAASDGKDAPLLGSLGAQVRESRGSPGPQPPTENTAAWQSLPPLVNIEAIPMHLLGEKHFFHQPHFYGEVKLIASWLDLVWLSPDQITGNAYFFFFSNNLHGFGVAAKTNL